MTGSRARLMADYALLGVPPEATDAEVRRARAAQVRMAHPDLEPLDKKAATRRLIAVNDAFARIMAARRQRETTLDQQPWRRSNSRTDGTTQAERPRSAGTAAPRSGQPPDPSRRLDEGREGSVRPGPRETGRHRSATISVDPDTALALGARGKRVVGAKVWQAAVDRAGGLYPDPSGLAVLVADWPAHQLPDAMVARSLRVAVGRVEIAVEWRKAARPRPGQDVVVIPDLSFSHPGRMRLGSGVVCLEVLEVIDRVGGIACRCRARGRPDLDAIVFEAIPEGTPETSRSRVA